MRPLSFASVRAWRWLIALVIAAVALWCTRGLLDIVSGPAGDVMRVAMLPPWWLLAILVVVLGAAGLGIFAAPDVLEQAVVDGLVGVRPVDEGDGLEEIARRDGGMRGGHR